jgi:hypothetical protein
MLIGVLAHPVNPPPPPPPETHISVPNIVNHKGSEENIIQFSYPHMNLRDK